MRVALAILAMLILAPAAAAASDRQSAPLLSGVREARAATFRCQDAVGAARSPVADVTPQGYAYRRWVLRLWTSRKQQACSTARLVRTPEGAIRFVFGRYADEALSVAWCESRLDVWATNGQYVNILQMGYNERRAYGWHVAGSPPLVAARAAYRYFAATGYDWSPWQCRPGGRLAW